VAGTGGAPATCQQIAAAGGACDLMAGPFCPELTHCVTTTDGGTSGSCQYSSASLCN
jgi:hypothetical protein